MREIPPEEFTLEENTYEGVQLYDRLDVLRPKYEITRCEVDTQLPGHASHSAIMARKFVLGIRNIKLSTRISTLQNKAIPESFTAPFVNLTEFVHLDCSTFFQSFVYYHFLLDNEALEFPHIIWEPNISSGGYKSAYDVLIDSMIKCNLLSPWTRLIGMKANYQGGREGMRCLLVLHCQCGLGRDRHL